ncbi:MAG: hypothetical protein RLZ98_2823 [Pseudomonadota bacterium]
MADEARPAQRFAAYPRRSTVSDFGFAPKRPWRAPARPGVSPVRAAPPSRLPQSGHLRMRPFARRDASDYAAGGESGDKYFLGELNGVCGVCGLPEVTCPGPGLRRGDVSCGSGRVPEQRAVRRFPKDGVLWREREGRPSHAKQRTAGAGLRLEVRKPRSKRRARSAKRSEAESRRSAAWGRLCCKTRKLARLDLSWCFFLIYRLACE